MINGEGAEQHKSVSLDNMLSGAGGNNLPFAPVEVKEGEGQPTPPVINNQEEKPEGATSSSGLPAQYTPPANEEVSDFQQTINIFNTDENTLSTEDRELRTNILSIFNGEKVDNTGNLLNAEGKVILSADNFKKYIEEDILPVDAKGNQVNELGEILFSKEELDTKGSITLSTKKTLEQEFGVTLERNDYPDTEEGIVEVAKDIISKSNTNVIGNFLESNPELKSLFLHLKTGGTLDKFSSTFVNYNQIDINKLDTDGKLHYVKEMFTKQGMDGTAYVDILKKAGDKEIDKVAAQAILFLDEKQTELKSTKEKEYKESLLAQEQADKEYWKSVDETIKKGKVGNINIPQSERGAFFDFLSKPIDKEGNTANGLKLQEESVESEVMLAYLRYKDFDVSKLATLIAKEQRVESLKERAARQRNSKVISEGTQNSHSGVGAKPISIEGLTRKN